MTAERPVLEQFRIEDARDGLVHLIFDMPGRTMNVFSNAAIHELARFAAWLKQSDVRGVVVRSGKSNAFCAGADLGELGVAYDMIVAARPEDRFDIAFDHFFALSRAIRALERAGKPVAMALAGLALGGGCELALGGHYRVAVDDPKVALGLPESLVGLLPGGGGTQRLPRLIGIEAALPVLLQGAKLAGRAALDAGLVHRLVAPGEEAAAAESWLLSDAATAVQPWDRADHEPVSHATIAAPVAAARKKALAETLGHYPAPLAILDCIEQGCPQSFDAAIRTEMSIFSCLIQRREARDMIQTMFLGKLDYERARAKGAISPALAAGIERLKAGISARATGSAALAAAGFRNGLSSPAPVQSRVAAGYWLDSADRQAGDARAAVAAIAAEAGAIADHLSQEERRMADYALVVEAGFPAYLGGPFAQAAARA